MMFILPRHARYTMHAFSSFCYWYHDITRFAAISVYISERIIETRPPLINALPGNQATVSLRIFISKSTLNWNLFIWNLNLNVVCIIDEKCCTCLASSASEIYYICMVVLCMNLLFWKMGNVIFADRFVELYGNNIQGPPNYVSSIYILVTSQKQLNPGISLMWRCLICLWISCVMAMWSSNHLIALTHSGRDNIAAIFADDIFKCIFLN